jgi:hypothetical protein
MKNNVTCPLSLFISVKEVAVRRIGIRIRKNPKLYAESESKLKYGFGFGSRDCISTVYTAWQIRDLNEKKNMFSLFHNLTVHLKCLQAMSTESVSEAKKIFVDRNKKIILIRNTGSENHTV